MLLDFLGNYLIGFVRGVLEHFLGGSGAGRIAGLLEEPRDLGEVGEGWNAGEPDQAERGLSQRAVGLLAFEGLEGAVLRPLMHLDVALEASDLFRLFGVSSVFDGSGFELAQEAGGAEQAGSGRGSGDPRGEFR